MPSSPRLRLPRFGNNPTQPIHKRNIWMNPDFAIDPSAADARRETRRCIPILQAPRNKADAALRTIPRGLRNGLFAPFSVSLFYACPFKSHSVPTSCLADRSGNPAIYQTQNLG